MHDGGGLPAGPSGGALEIDAGQLSSLAPFVLTVDRSLVVTWASAAILKRIHDAVGADLSGVMQSLDPPEDVPSRWLERTMGQVSRMVLLGETSTVSLRGRWLPIPGGFLLLAVPDAKTSQELESFSFDDFPEGNHLIELMTLQNEVRVSLQDAALAVASLRQTNAELEKSKRELSEKIRETGRQRQAILNILEDMRKSKEELESVNT
ncbi:MAG: hypothetical protein V2A71_05625, partial [Candidatus Eisenbacteria bacterium]